MGHVVAWSTENWEIVAQLKLELSSITTVSAVESIAFVTLFVQIKSGKILVYSFNGNEFNSLTEENFNCGTYTFCRMSTLSLNDSNNQRKLLVSFPDAEFENTISVMDFSSKNKNYLLKAFKCDSLKSASTGMCLFTKLYKSSSDDFIILICGYESGHLVIIKLFTSENGRHEHEIIFESKIMDESCINAALNLSENNTNTVVVAVGAGNSIKIIRNIESNNSIEDLKSIEIPANGCNSVSIRPDGKLFVTAGWDAK